MAMAIAVRRVRGLWSGTGSLKRSTRPHGKRGDEQFVNRHKLAPEFEMQPGSAQSQEEFLVAWVLREATRPKQENQRRRERHRCPRILRGYLLICAAPRPSWRGFVALSHEPLGSDVNALQRLVVGDRHRRHCGERNAHGVQRR